MIPFTKWREIMVFPPFLEKEYALCHTSINRSKILRRKPVARYHAELQDKITELMHWRARQREAIRKTTKYTKNHYQ